MQKKLSEEEINGFWSIYNDFINNKALERLYSTKQHRTSNTYRHVCLVAKYCVEYVIKHNLHYDAFSLIRGAFLHDFFFYDWRKDKTNKKGHLTKHPDRALKNASAMFLLTPTEEDIIKNHMWPINFTHFPKTKEGRLVMMMDKKATLNEFFSKKKKLIIFDMDGTILDTLESLNNAVNYALKLHNFPTKTLEDTRLAIGNGVAILIKRLLPNNVDENTYKKVLNDFANYYNKNFMEGTKDYPGMHETLLTLRREGYQLAVSTNKLENIAQELVDKFYNNLFLIVCGDNGLRNKKPAPDSIYHIMKELKIHNKKQVLYIGDTEIDYQTAKNAGIDFKLVTYGYRNEEELNKKITENNTYISSTKDFIDLFCHKEKRKEQ